jgi:hypothetical protein
MHNAKSPSAVKTAAGIPTPIAILSLLESPPLSGAEVTTTLMICGVTVE